MNDVVLNANAEWIAGGTRESGVATLKVKGADASRLDLIAGQASRSEIRNGTAGRWVGPDGVPHAMALHNCWAPAGWFAPHALARGMSNHDAVLRYVGHVRRNGAEADHVRVYRTTAAKNAKFAHDLERLSTIDVFLDSTTHLPLAVLFNTHPDNDLERDIAVEIRFADYRSVNGVQVPFRIQRLLQGVLNLDLTITSASVNSGLADSDFAVQ